MKIHQIAPSYIPVDPYIAYGGIERVMYQLDKKLSEKGHKTSMSAVKGSNPVGTLYATTRPVGLGDSKDLMPLDEFYLKLNHMAISIKDAREGDFDIIHVHEENMLPYLGFLNKPAIYTIHSIPEEFWNPGVDEEIIRMSKGHNLVSVSNRIKEIYNSMGFDVKYTAHNGFDIDEKYFSDEKDDYLLSLGIILPKKGQDIAIEVSRRLKKPLIIAGNIGDKDYFESKIKPFITDNLVQYREKLGAYRNLSSGHKIVYVGKVNDIQKYPLYSKASAFLMTSVVEDPLPGVVIEAMACGTPVIGFKKGGVPEMIENGKTGFVVEDIEQMTEAVLMSGKIEPVECFQRYKEHFTSDAMAERYLNIYKKVLENGKK